MKILRGDIVLVNFEPVMGAEQGKIRPAVILQNNLGNQYSPITIVAPITSKKFSREFPTNVFIPKETSGLDKDSTILMNQIKAIDKLRIKKTLSSLNGEVMKKVDLAIKISLDIN